MPRKPPSNLRTTAAGVVGEAGTNKANRAAASMVAVEAADPAVVVVDDVGVVAEEARAVLCLVVVLETTLTRNR